MDPRRRLQVLNSSSPSLRVAAAPKQPQLTVGVAKQQPLYVNTGGTVKRIDQSPTARTSSVAERQELARQSSPDHFGLDDIVKTAGHIAGEVARPVVATGLNWSQIFGNIGTHLAGGKSQTGEEFWDGPLSGVAKFAGGGNANNLGTTRNIVGNAAQVGSYIIPGAAEIKSLSLPARVGIDAAAAAIGNSAHTFTNEADASVGDYLKSAGIGSLFGGGLRLLGGAVGAVKNRNAAKSLGLTSKELKGFVKSDDITQIAADLADKFGVDIQDAAELAERIANSQTTEEVVNVMRHTPFELLGTGAVGAYTAAALGRSRYELAQDAAQGAAKEATPALPEVWIGPGDPPPGYSPGSIPLNPTSEQAYNEALKDAGRMLNDDSLVKEAEDNLRNSAVNHNAKDAVKQPQNAAAVVRGADPNSADSLTTLINSLAKSPNKNEVRKLIESVFKNDDGTSVLESNDLNRLIKDITKDSDAASVTQKLSDALDKVVVKVNAEEPSAPQTGKQVTEEQIAQAAPNSGAVPTEIAPNGARIVKDRQPTAPVAQADNVGEVVNKSADEAAATVKPSDDGSITYTNKNGNTRAMTNKDINEQIAELKAEAEQGGLSAAKQKKLEELQDLQNVSQFDAKAAFPDLLPEEQKAVQEVMDKQSEALKLYDKNIPVRAKERARRFAQGAGNFESAGGGEAGMAAKLSALRGDLSKSKYEPIAATPETRDTILNLIEEVGRGNGMRAGEILNTQQAMRKVWGTVEGKPTPADVRNIRNFFGNQMADLVQEAVKASPKTWRDQVAAVAGIPKTLMSTADLSAGFRQAGVLGSGHPAQWAKAQLQSLKYAKNNTYYRQEMEKIANDPAYRLAQESKLDLPAVEDLPEEAYAGSDLVKKVPVVKSVVNVSERAYDGLLTKLRFEVFKDQVSKLGGEEVLTKKDLRDLAEAINTASGRGGKAGGLIDKHAATLSTTLFSPRLWASRLNQLNPYYYARLSGPARKEALRNAAAFASVASTVLLAAKASGFDVETDARSSDFLKIKKGNTRYDILGGFQQNLVFAWREISGEYKSSTSGNVSNLSDPKYGGMNRFEVGLNLGTNKLNPLLGAATRLLKGEEMGGGKLNPLKEIGQLFIPLNVQGMFEAANDVGSLGDPKALATGVAKNSPGIFGIGVQTYGETATKDKGKPGVTLAEKLDAADQDQEDALAEFDAGLSADEKLLTGKSQTALQKLVDDGTIDKDMYNQVIALKKARDNIKGVDVPDGLSNDATKAFYKRYNSLTESGQKKFLESSKPDQNAIDLTTSLNKDRPAGLSPVKPSNKIAKLYSDFEIKQNTEKWSATEKIAAEKALWKEIAKAGRSDTVNDLYSSSIGNLKSAISHGDIGKKDLNEAIKLDNELYAAGLISSLHFSKKFRSLYGYGTPAKRSTGGSGGSGSGSKEKRAYLADLLTPEASSKRSGGVPTFSKTPRNVKLKVPSTVKFSSGSGKKVRINL